MKRSRFAVLLSGNGTTLQAILDARAAGALAADIVLVVADRPGVRGLERAQEAGIPRAVVARRNAKGQAYARLLEATLAPHEPDWLVLAGFLTCFPIPERWRDRVVNIHPSLLPAFGGKGYYGQHVHRQVLAHGCRVTGCTVHLATDDVDAGPILEQKAVRVRTGDSPETLARRVQAAERRLYPRVLHDLATGRLWLEHGVVRRAEAKSSSRD